MNAFTNHLNQAVRRLKKRGHSLTEIANLAGISRVYLYRLLRGEQSVSLDLAEQISRKLSFKIFR